MKDKVKVNFNGEEFEIKKIAIRDIGKLASTLNNLPEVFTDVFGDGEGDELNETNLIEKLPVIIMQASETLPPFLAVASGIELEKILDGGLDDLVVLIEAVLSINNFSVIWNSLKNVLQTQ